MRFKIDWASLVVRNKFTIFAVFYFVFEGNFPSTSPLGAYIWRGDLTEGFLHYWIGGPIFGGAYTWGGLFSEFYSTPLSKGLTENYGVEKVVSKGSNKKIEVVGICSYTGAVLGRSFIKNGPSQKALDS